MVFLSLTTLPHNPPIPTHVLRHLHLPTTTTTTKKPRYLLLRPLSATRFPSSPPPGGELYQPFRPPPSPLPPQYRSLSTPDRLDVLRNRLGLWFEYAPLIPSLAQEGFTPPSIEEATGLSGVEQNRLVVAAQVRDSLLSSSVSPDELAFFDSGGAELLYELRLLNAPQRAASARYIVRHRLDPKGAQQLARAVKDFPRRREDPGWESFSGSSPADCVAFADYRLSREAISDADREAALERALKAAETDVARERIEEALRKTREGEMVEEAAAAAEAKRILVVRLRYGEIAEATSVVLVPVCDAAEGEAGVVGAPGYRPEGEFGVVVAEKGWAKWAVLPGWEPVMGIRLGGGVAVAFPDARVLPWRMNRSEKEEAVLVVVDRERREVVEGGSGFYLVGGDGGRLVVERGERLTEKGVAEAVATVVLVVRPPSDDLDDQIADDDWD